MELFSLLADLESVNFLPGSLVLSWREAWLRPNEMRVWLVVEARCSWLGPGTARLPLVPLELCCPGLVDSARIGWVAGLETRYFFRRRSFVVNGPLSEQTAHVHSLPRQPHESAERWRIAFALLLLLLSLLLFLLPHSE